MTAPLLDGAGPVAVAVAAALVGIIGTARLTRLLTEDTFPPVAWLRNRWISWFNDSAWAELVICPFCLAPYLAAVTIGWAWATDLHWSWYLFYGWLSLSYLAAILVARDIPADQR